VGSSASLPAHFTILEAAQQLRVSRTWLDAFLKDKPYCYRKAGNRKRFTAEHIQLISDAMRPIPIAAQIASAVSSAGGLGITGPRVYFVGFNCYVKIGHTSGLLTRTRMASLQTGCPEPLQLYYEVAGGIELEAELHKKFATDRLLGEWFQYSKAIQEWIADHHNSLPISSRIF
jgi:hypothetical protein